MQKMARTVKFKYNLNHYIGMLPRSLSVENIIDVLKKEHAISRDAFYRDRNLLIDDVFSIPSDRLDIYAGLFGVTTDELKNFKPKKIKPLAQRKLSTTKR